MTYRVQRPKDPVPIRLDWLSCTQHVVLWNRTYIPDSGGHVRVLGRDWTQAQDNVIGTCWEPVTMVGLDSILTWFKECF